MTKPMDEMPVGWMEVMDGQVDILTSNIAERTKIQLRVIRNSRIPEGKNGHILIQRRHPDRYSTLFTFDDLNYAFTWLCGFDSATSCIRLKPAEIYFV